MDAPAELLAVENLRVTRGTTRILSGINWRIQRGQHWAILGANGSGKTTLLAALMAYVTPSHGDIRLLGQSYGAEDWTELRKSLGMVSNALTRHIPPAETALHTVLSGESAQLGYWSRQHPAHEAKARRCLSRMGAGRLANRTWGVLSQGERQKVLIARALMPAPRLLILDEPCAGLDPVARGRFLATLRKLASEKHGPALILVTHHVEEIIPEISHVLILRRGRVLAADPAGEVLTNPILSQAFGAPVCVEHGANQSWILKVPGKEGAQRRKP